MKTVTYDPDQWQLVPKEPTRTMLDEAHCDLDRSGEIDPMVRLIYGNMLYKAPQPPVVEVEPVEITEADAERVGAKGAEPTEAERKLFEAWMRGHCWAVTGIWDGKTYRGSSEHGEYVDQYAMHLRGLWAAWRDRASLSTNTDTEALRQRVNELESKVAEYDKRIVAIGGIAINSIPRNSYDGMVATQAAMIVRLQEAVKAAYFEAWHTLAARNGIPMNGDDETDFAESEVAKTLTTGA